MRKQVHEIAMSLDWGEAVGQSAEQSQDSGEGLRFLGQSQFYIVLSF